MLQEGEEPTADGQGFKHRDRQVGPGIFGDFVEPEQAVAETTGSGSVNIGEASVGGYVEEGSRRISELCTEQGSLVADAARLEE